MFAELGHWVPGSPPGLPARPRAAPGPVRGHQPVLKLPGSGTGQTTSPAFCWKWPPGDSPGHFPSFLVSSKSEMPPAQSARSPGPGRAGPSYGKGLGSCRRPLGHVHPQVKGSLPLTEQAASCCSWPQGLPRGTAQAMTCDSPLSLQARSGRPGRGGCTCQPPAPHSAHPHTDFTGQPGCEPHPGALCSQPRLGETRGWPQWWGALDVRICREGPGRVAGNAEPRPCRPAPSTLVPSLPAPRVSRVSASVLRGCAGLGRSTWTASCPQGQWVRAASSRPWTPTNSQAHVRFRDTRGRTACRHRAGDRIPLLSPALLSILRVSPSAIASRKIIIIKSVFSGKWHWPSSEGGEGPQHGVERGCRAAPRTPAPRPASAAPSSRVRSSEVPVQVCACQQPACSARGPHCLLGHGPGPPGPGRGTGPACSALFLAAGLQAHTPWGGQQRPGAGGGEGRGEQNEAKCRARGTVWQGGPHTPHTPEP